MKALRRSLLTLALTLAAVPAHAQVVTPNPPPTVITSAPYTISAPGFYQLGANLVVSNTTGAIITINSGNVTLDFAGHYISGPANAASTLVGVSAYEKGNLVIQNGTVAYCYRGIHLDGNGTSTSLNINQRVQNMLVTYCYQCGIRFTGAYNSVFANNRVSFITNGTGVVGVQGIYDYSGTGNIADGNIVTNVKSTSGSGAAVGIAGALTNMASSLTVTNNRVSNVTNTSNAGLALGIFEGSFVIGNTVNNAYQAIYTEGKYKDNLTFNSTDPLAGGTDAGGNN